MNANLLHVFIARSNPIRWVVPHNVYKENVQHMLDSGVNVHVIECQYGDRPFECELPGIDHIGVRAKTMVWNKENLLNIAIRRTPQAQYIAWIDSDVFFRRPNWAVDTVHALQLYDVVQPWSDAYDLGPNDEHLQHHKSFISVYNSGAPVHPSDIVELKAPNSIEPYAPYTPTVGVKLPPVWKSDGGVHDYPHSGYAWAITRQAYDWVGGLFDVGGMGSGDHHMALALVGKAENSLPGGTSESYRKHVLRWQSRALQHINKNIGFVHGTIEHRFHGRKPDRQYVNRWGMFIKHGFDPDEDLKINHNGVYEWAGNKPELRREFDRYLRSRNEDVNSLL